MLERKDIIALMKAAADTAPSTCFSFNGENLSSAAINATLREQLSELAGTYDLYRANKNQLFSLIEEAVNDILPQRVLEAYGRFAEIRQFPQGTMPIFTRKLGRVRAKQFITRVGLAGVYEVFKLGETNYEVKTSAIGGAAQIGFEEFLDGRVDFAEVVQIVMDGMDELIYREIAAALMGAINQLPAANRVAVAGFNEDAMDQLISVASAYGAPAIYCTREFAQKMVPQSGWVSDSMREQRWNLGYFANYKGVPVIILPQSFEDETNAKKVIDPGYAWVMHSDEKPVKVAFEGTLHVRDRENEDWSRDMQCYQKVGVGVIMTNSLCSYIDTQLQGHLTWPASY